MSAKQSLGPKHGYNLYSNGRCGCDICKAAKKERMREYRTYWRRLRKEHLGPGPYVVSNITHGITGYGYFSCRCLICVAAKADAHQRTKEQ